MMIAEIDPKNPSAAEARAFLTPIKTIDVEMGVKLAEERFGITRSRDTVRYWAATEGFAVRVGGRWRILVPPFLAFLSGDREALKAFLAGDRSSPQVMRYVAMQDLVTPTNGG